ncbi:hypothetical protein [Escherichia coli ISC7]|uniref:Uncharacterized protein n=1 Tax=Escherichia coli ISC7 TaxID=1432555 RepID=W1EYZ5_ECOLX|nr:hypothetical protein [Escherichia coli ISC7]
MPAVMPLVVKLQHIMPRNNRMVHGGRKKAALATLFNIMRNQ